MESKYYIGDIVWVKIKGYPWWPGIVSKYNYLIAIQIKSIIFNENISNKENKNKLSPKNQSYKYIIRFFIELTECIIRDVSKIQPYQKYKKEFSKTKQKKLKNAIKFADKIALGEMSFEQHSSFIKEGIKLYEEQCRKLEQIKEEEKEKRLNRLNIGNKKDSIDKKVKRKKLIFRKNGMLGKKRNFVSSTNKKGLINDLIYSIDDFIFNKRDFKPNDYELFFKEIKIKISKNRLNTNGLNVSPKRYNLI